MSKYRRKGATSWMMILLAILLVVAFVVIGYLILDWGQSTLALIPGLAS